MRAAFLVLLLTGSASAAGWQTTQEKDGVTFDKRSVDGSKYFEYRASFDTSVGVAPAIEIIWSDISRPPGAHVTHRDFIERTDSVIVIHDQLKTPVVSDRELTLRMWREPSAVRFAARNDLGPAPLPGHVQLPDVHGGWVLVPRGTGSHVEYTCYSEPGGSVPAFMVRGQQQSQVEKDIERVRARLK